jgi:5-(carboxyamino)imidazole ribonucleotide synthase
MLALAAARLGLRTHIYTYEPDAPALRVSGWTTQVINENRDGLLEFAESCNVVTYEFENISRLTLETIAELTPVYPGIQALTASHDRLDEKHFLRKLGIETAPFWHLTNEESCIVGYHVCGPRAILKTRRFGYDGKGQVRVNSEGELLEAHRSFGATPLILEGMVDFAFEASVIAVRGRDGSLASYDSPENIHEHQILRRSIVPSRLSASQADEAKAIAKKIADALDYVGVLAVELFVMKDGSLLVNEIAPRVHNSGHWTIDACLVSQFENHIRAVAGWPLGSTERHSDAVMENLIGEEAADWKVLAAKGGALHLYGKSEIRAGRKMGHVTYIKQKTNF